MMKENKIEIQNQIHQIVFEFEETFHIKVEEEFYEHSGLLAIINSKLAFYYKLNSENTKKMKIIICSGGYPISRLIEKLVPVEIERFNCNWIDSMLDSKSHSHYDEELIQKSYRENVRNFMKKGKKY